MTLESPGWLLAALPLLVTLRLWRVPSRLVERLRLAVGLLAILAMARPALRLPSRAGTVVVLVDRSASMPSQADAAAKEAIARLQKSKPDQSRLAVVSFGETATVELAPGAGRFDSFTARVGAEGSDVAHALATALALVPRGAPGRVLLLSDGRATGPSPLPAAFEAAGRRIAVDTRLVERPATNDLAVDRIEGPDVVSPGEGFLVTAWIDAPAAQDATYELRRDGRPLARGTRAVAAGLTRLVFRDLAERPGAQAYELRVQGSSPDPVPENDTARLLVGVRGRAPLLLLTPRPDGGLARLLTTGGVAVDAARPEDADLSLAGLARHAGVLLEDVPADRLGGAALGTLAAWVKDGGAGLMMTGGRTSYGPGGYFRSPLDPLLPVSMELRQEHRKLALSMVVVMDRSGSMAATAGGGRTKMDLANLGAAQVLELLSAQDEFGVIVVDSIPHTIAPLEKVEDRPAVRTRILSVESMGGGIFVYEGLFAAARMMEKATAGTRHILLFADAADSEEPGEYKMLLEKLRGAGITVSVIGLGTKADPDAGLLEDIAKRGDGRVFFTNQPDELPALFAQDTFIAARSTFVEEATPFRFTAGLTTLTGRAIGVPPPLGGFNLCYLRPGATLAAVTKDDYEAPVVATWQAGAGRVACYTGEADGKTTGAMGTWPETGPLLASLARYTLGDGAGLPAGLLVRQRPGSGHVTIELESDPDEPAATAALGAGERPEVTALRGRPGSPPQVTRTRLEPGADGVLRAELPIHGSETLLASVEAAGRRVALAPVCLPYAPEFRRPGPESGAPLLARLAALTGGVERADLGSIWKDLRREPRMIDLAPALFLLSALLLLLEVLERRTAVLSAWGALERRPRTAKPATTRPAPSPAPAVTGTRAATAATPDPAAPAAPPAATAPSPLTDALEKARRAARERSRRD